MPLMFFIGCEDEDGTASEDSLVGTWNFVATEYDTTCTGDGEVFLEGTMVFDDENVTFTRELGFDSFCSDIDGSLVDDTTCASYYFNITLSMLHEMCAEEGMTLTDGGCAESLTNTYTFNESLYINNVEIILNNSTYDCIILSDYNNGVLSKQFTENIIDFVSDPASEHIHSPNHPLVSEFLATRSKSLFCSSGALADDSTWQTQNKKCMPSPGNDDERWSRSEFVSLFPQTP